jgi:hypothetical protein
LPFGGTGGPGAAWRGAPPASGCPIGSLPGVAGALTVLATAGRLDSESEAVGRGRGFRSVAASAPPSICCADIGPGGDVAQMWGRGRTYLSENAGSSSHRRRGCPPLRRTWLRLSGCQSMVAFVWGMLCGASGVDVRLRRIARRKEVIWIRASGREECWGGAVVYNGAQWLWWWTWFESGNEGSVSVSVEAFRVSSLSSSYSLSPRPDAMLDKRDKSDQAPCPQCIVLVFQVAWTLAASAGVRWRWYSDPSRTPSADARAKPKPAQGVDDE